MVDADRAKAGVSSWNLPSAPTTSPLVSVCFDSVSEPLAARPHQSGHEAQAIRISEFAVEAAATVAASRKAGAAYSKP